MKAVKFLATLAFGALMALPVFAAELKIGLSDDADVLDPAQSRSFVGRIVYTALCDKLFDVTPDLQIVPQLATAWEWSRDSKELTLTLRQGVKFQDGTPFNAQAVVDNLQRSMTMPESRRKSELSSIDKVEAMGEYEAKITLKAPDVTLLAQLSDRAGMMISPKAAKELGAKFGDHPVCSGPFKFVERIQQDRIVLEKFQDYWNKDNIFLDKVIYRPIPDSTVRLANLRSGDLDLIERVAPTDVAAVKDDPNLKLADKVNIGNLGIYVNVGNGPRADNPMGKDKRLRQAFSLAIDREAAMQIVYDGTGVAGNQAFSPSSPWYNKNIPVPARDVEKAKALVKAAGYDRVPVELSMANDPVIVQMMQVIQAMVAEAGFDVKLRETEFATLLNDETAGNYQMSRTDWSGRVDPDGNVEQFYTCGAGLNDMHYCNPEVDKLLADARQSQDNAARKQKYDAASVILNDELPIIYIGHQAWIWGYNKKVTGFVPSPDGMIRLVGVKNGN